MLKYVTVVLLIVVTVACSGHSRKPENESLAVFSTNILDNDTKLFVFSLEKPKRRPKPSNDIRQQRSSKGSSRGPEGAARAVSHKDRTSKMEEELDERLLAMIGKTGYCRKGFVILDKNVSAEFSSIRGECKDAATPKDRESFING